MPHALRFALFILSFLLLSLALRAQTRLQGQVTDAATGKPLPFATVYVNTTTRGTTADEKGTYNLPGLSAGTVEVVASYLGYRQAKTVITLRPGLSKTVNLKLEPTGNALAGVTVRARRSKAWERLFRQFKRELLGDSPFAGRCVLLNEQAIVLTEEAGRLKAQATEPIVFENNALGYRIYFDMLSFEYYQGAAYYGGATRFDELKPETPEQLKRWQRNRQAAYEGSTRHLLASMIAGTHEQEGYLVYQSNIDLNRQAPLAPILQFESAKRPPLARMDSIFRPGGMATERTMVLNKPLEIFYTRTNARNSPYRDMPYGYSLLVLPYGEAVVTTRGWVATPNGMELRGYLGKDRFANLLPADWQPTADAAPAPDQPLAEGVVLPPDNRIDSLKRAWKKVQALAPPVVYLHTDKNLYSTGDVFWFSAYLLHPATGQLLPNRYADVDEALHVDWLDPAGKLIYHQWVRIRNGRGAGSLFLPDTLPTGSYTLRAYTEAGRAEVRPAFEQTVLLVNGVSGAVPEPAGEVPARPDASRPGLAMRPAVDSLSLKTSVDTVGIRVQVGATGRYRSQAVYLLIQSGERVVGQAKIGLTDGAAQVVIPAARVPSGMLRLVLFDAQGNPRAERLVAATPEPIRLHLTADKPRYAPREKTTLRLQLQDQTGDPLPGYLSVSVTDADQLPPDSLTRSLPAQLSAGLLGSRHELIPGRSTLLPDTTVGIVIRGRALDRRKRPLPNARLLLSFAGAKDSFARSAAADEQGRFQIDGLTLTDSAEVTAQVMGTDLKPVKGTIEIASPTEPMGEGGGSPWPVDSSARPDWNRYRMAIRMARLRQQADPDLYRPAGVRQLSAVTVRATRTDDQISRSPNLHGTADATVTFKETANQYANVFEMMRGKLPGVQINFNPQTGIYSVIVRGVGSFGSSNGPLFLLDGQYVDTEILMATNPAQIERIELVKNSSAAIYGARGGAGVIALFSRSWQPDQPGQVTKKTTVTGFSTPQLFSGSAEAISTDPGRIDRRDVLFWAPTLQTDAQGNATVSFPLTDIVRTLRVTVQGIMADGQPIFNEQLIQVQ